MRVEGAVTTISWIPSEAVTGPLNKPIFDSGVTHYDAPPPDFIGDLPPLGSWMAEDRFRFANRLSAAVDFADDGSVRTAEYTGGLFLNATIAFLAVAGALFFLVKGINQMRRQEAAPTLPPAAPSAEERLLTEIRDLLRR